ncbi:MAG: hypothetical protein AB7I33_07505 [Gemmatimonadales bacterium]
MAYSDGAAYRVTRGASLTVELGEAYPAGPEALIRLAGPVTAFVTALCDCLPLHACGIVVGHRILAVHGDSGAGKSTLAALALRGGLSIAGDDLLACTKTGTVLGLPGGLRLAPPYDMARSPCEVRLPDGRGWYPLDPVATLPLAALLRLRRGERPRLHRVRGRERLVAALEAGFLTRHITLPAESWHEHIAEVAARPVFDLEVPDGLDRLADSWDEVRSLLESLC